MLFASVRRKENPVTQCEFAHPAGGRKRKDQALARFRENLQRDLRIFRVGGNASLAAGAHCTRELIGEYRRSRYIDRIERHHRLAAQMKAARCEQHGHDG